jgi:starvation-inducible DNA-binding protein
MKTKTLENSRSNGKVANRTFTTSIDIDAKARAELVALLNVHLACHFDLLSQTKQAHWNVKGREFIALHKLFDEFAEGLEGYVDMLAERVTALGGYATGTVRMAAAASLLAEYPTSATDGMDHVRALSERYATQARLVRAAIDETDGLGDKDTADLFTEISRDLDKWLWFLEAHLQG